MSEFILRDMAAEDLCGYVARQLNLFFPDKRPISQDQLRPVMGDRRQLHDPASRHSRQQGHSGWLPAP